MIDTRQTQSDTFVAEPKRGLRPALVFATALVAVVLAVGGSVLWLGGGIAQGPASEATQPVVPTAVPEATTLPATTMPIADTVPTITFDGAAASYSGPATFDENTLTFKLVNNAVNVRAGFGWNVLNDETITLEEEIAYMETHRGDNYSIPSWVEAWGAIDFALAPNTVVEESVRVSLQNGKCLLYVWDAHNRILYPAAHITVSGG